MGTGTEMSTVGGMSDENNDTSAASDKPPVNDVRVNDLADILETGTNNQDGNESDGKTESEVSIVNTYDKVKGKELDDEVEKKRLVQMGLSTALAIALHNFPEGLATFVAALDDPKVGAVLAVALGIHNIPEGLCVALPVYYATGNRMKGFGWAV